MGGPGGEEGSALDACHLNHVASAHVESPARLAAWAFGTAAATPKRKARLGGPCGSQRPGRGGTRAPARPPRPLKAGPRPEAWLSLVAAQGEGSQPWCSAQTSAGGAPRCALGAFGCGTELWGEQSQISLQFQFSPPLRPHS